MSEPLLVAHGLYKSYGEIQAVRGLSLPIERGEIFGLPGPNGGQDHHNFDSGLAARA